MAAVQKASVTDVVLKPVPAQPTSMFGRFANAMAETAAPPAKMPTKPPDPGPIKQVDSSAWLDSLVEANFGPGAETDVG
eukprot:scaffold420322_cov45-Prasinocladus_malaysianus.AAC.1